MKRQMWNHILAGLILAGGCSWPEKPQAPSFEVDLDLPVALERVTMQEVVSERSDYLSVDSKGQIGVRIEQEVDRFTVGNNLRLDVPELAVGAQFSVSQGGKGESGVFLELPEGILVSDSQVQSGTLFVELSSVRGARATVSLPDFKIDGNPVVIQGVIPEGGTTVLAVPLAGAVYRPTRPGHILLEQSYTPTQEFFEGTVTDRITGRLRPATLLMNHIRGSFTGIRVDFPPSVRAVEFPDGQYDVKLSEASVDVQMDNGIGANTLLDMTVIGRREDGRSVSLTVPEDQRQIPAGNPSAPVRHVITFNEDNSNILEFLNLLPTTVEIRGGIVIEDEDARVAQTDGVEIGVVLTAPFHLVLGETQILTSPRDVGIDDQEVREALETHIGAASVDFKLISHLPIGGGVRLLVGRDSTRLETDPDLVIPREGAISLPAAPVDPATGLVREAVETRTAVALTPADVDVFGHFPLFARIELRLPGTGGQAVRVVEGDFVEILVRAGFRVRIDKDL